MLRSLQSSYWPALQKGGSAGGVVAPGSLAGFELMLPAIGAFVVIAPEPLAPCEDCIWVPALPAPGEDCICPPADPCEDCI